MKCSPILRVGLALTMILVATILGGSVSWAWSGTGHFVMEAIGYVPGGYTVQPSFRQASTSANAAQSAIGSIDTADMFVNFAFDTYGKTVYLVYTTNGSAPTKSNGTVTVAAFSNYANPNRTWRASIPPQAADTVVNYLFYISDGSLANGWGASRHAGHAQHQPVSDLLVGVGWRLLHLHGRDRSSRRTDHNRR